MIGTLDRSKRGATVVGAGIAGLLIADALDRAGYRVTLLEKAERAGGLIRTVQTDYGIAETAAHSLLVTPAARALFARLGVELRPLREDSRARYILRDGRMRRMPLSPLEMFGAFARAYFVLARRLPPGAAQTLGQWADRHLGKAARDYLLGPFVRGIYGAEPEQLELALAFPALALPPGHSLLSFQLRRLRRRWLGQDPKPSAKRAMMAPAPGMGALVDSLSARLRERLGDRFQLGHPVSELPHTADNVILTVPAYEAARFFEAEAALASALRAVAYTPLTSVTVFAAADSFPARQIPRGVGVLIPKREPARSALGILFNSSSFPGRAVDGVVSMTVMLPPNAENPGQAAEEEICALFGSAVRVLHREVTRWEKAIPRYDQALGAALETARSGWCAQPGRILFGNYTGQVSLRGMIDTVESLALSDSATGTG